MNDEANIPLGDVRAIAEALADVLKERGVFGLDSSRPVRVLTTTDVAEILGRDRRWVYAHAEELGAFRYGDGPKGRLGFDLEVIDRWKRERQVAARWPKHSRRGRPPKGNSFSQRGALLPFEA